MLSSFILDMFCHIVMAILLRVSCLHMLWPSATLLPYIFSALLQVAAGTQEAVQKLAGEMQHLKQNVSSMTHSRQQLQQQTGMLADPR